MTTESRPKLELYYFGSCVYCLITRIAIWWMGLKIPLKDVMFSEQNRGELLAGGGMTQVPCLRIEQPDGTILWQYESIAIIRYLKSTKQNSR